MQSGAVLYKKFRIIFAATGAVFFLCGAAAELYLSRAGAHVSDYIGDMLWGFLGEERLLQSTGGTAEYLLLLMRGFFRPALCCILLFLGSLTVYAPAVAFTVTSYAAFSLGASCMDTASAELLYVVYAAAGAASLITLIELSVCAAHLGRVLAHRAPPRASMLPAVPAVRGMFVSLCTGVLKLLLITAVWYALTPLIQKL